MTITFTLTTVHKMKIEEISKNEYEVGVINSIKDKEGAFRQMSKAPTFRTYLWGAVFYFNE